ncbi:Programmed cell death protein 2-like [Smittium mucronatum]|uniref:Programmed cell death protein 2-like n=1 Tax=Smittium mucronatum TaxID=133383 RepID=A0A1R0GTU4_9FUNG|nr:Programmed cell death protein 2-like [Smittium mucronatum]
MLDYVLLSYADGAQELADASDPYISKLGGKPTWLSEKENVHYPEKSIVLCDSCGELLVLLFQLYAPLPDSPYDRFLYLWGCMQKSCMESPGSFKVLRGHLLNIEYLEKLAKTKKTKKKPAKKSSGKQVVSKKPPAKINFGSIWDNDTEELDFNPTQLQSLKSSLAIVQPKSTEIGDLELDIKYLKISQNSSISSDLPYVPGQYVYSEYEKLDAGCKLDEYNNASSGDSETGDEQWTAEQYEATVLPSGIDTALDNFMGIISQNPEQVIRYQFGGTPLLYSTNDQVSSLLLTPGSSRDPLVEHRFGLISDDEKDDEKSSNTKYSPKNVPRCPHCNGKRTFELSVLPSIIHILHLSNLANSHRDVESSKLRGKQFLESINDGMEFGTLLVFVCENDCHFGTSCLPVSERDLARFSVPQYYQEIVYTQLESH